MMTIRSIYGYNKKELNNINFYGLIGDSIATGGVAEQPLDWPEEYKVVDSRCSILYKDDRTITNNYSFLPYSTQTNMNRYPGYSAVVASPETKAVGIDNTFMYYMRVNSVKNVGLVKWALGGTCLTTKAGADNDWGLASGEMFESFNRYVKNIGLCISSGQYNPTMKAMIVCLGTNDCVTGVYNNANFVAAIPLFVAAVRAAVGQPSLPIYWMQVRSDLYLSGLASYAQADVNAARLALSNCASGGATPITGFNLLDFESQTSTADTVHPDADANELMGLEIAETFLSLGE